MKLTLLDCTLIASVLIIVGVTTSWVPLTFAVLVLIGAYFTVLLSCAALLIVLLKEKICARIERNRGL